MNEVNLKIQKSEPNDITIDELIHTENGTLETISVIDMLQFIEYKDIPNILNLIKQKLSPKGTFVIKSPDIRQLCYLCITQHINEEQFSDIIKQSLSVTSLFSLAQLVQSSGLYILNKQLDSHYYLISGAKYEPKT